MMYVADLVVISAINNALKHLKDNPDEAEFLFSGYVCLKPLSELTGGYRFVKQIIDVLSGKDDKKIFVTPFYNMSSLNNYEIFVADSGAETIQFIGDQAPLVHECMPSDLYLRADASGVKDKNTLKFLRSTCACDILFTGLVAVLNDKKAYFQAKIKSISMDEEYVYVELDKELPKNGSSYKLRDWQFYSSNSSRVVNLHASLDDVSVSVMLRTVGDVELHKLLAIVVRYALKSQRPFLESNGLQVSRITSRSAPQEDSATQDVAFTTTFNLTCKARDMWVYQKSKIPDRIGLEVIAVSDNPNNEDITLVSDLDSVYKE